VGDAATGGDPSTRDAYRGPDRRAPVIGHPSSGRVALVVGATITVVAGTAGVVADRVGGSDVVGAEAAAAVAGVLAVLVAATAWAHGRATGNALPSRVAGGAGLLAVVYVGDLLSGPGGGLAGARSAAVLLAAVWVTAGLRGPAVEARHYLVRQALVTVAIVVVVGLASWVVGMAAGGSLPVIGRLGGLLGGVAWMAVAARCAVQIRRDVAALTGWILWSAVAVGSAELMTLILGDGAGVVAPVLRAAGLFTMALGVTSDSATHVAARRIELLRSRATAREIARVDRQRERVRDHELGNALFAIEGAALTLARHGEALPAGTRGELAGSIARGVEHVRTLTRDRAPTSVDVALGEVLCDRLRLAEGRGIRTRLTGDLATSGRADPTVVAQVIDNLVINAVRHGGAGGEEPVRVHVGPEGGWAVIRVSDAGPGIPDHAHRLVFEPGFRLDGGSEGDGLGLAVSRELLRGLGGDLVIAPGRRRGCCLVASLPLGLRVDGAAGDTRGGGRADGARIGAVEVGDGRAAPRG
jgi:signal transduction histidine kinase